MPRKVDVLVIGGGSTGTSIAYHLTKSGVEHVALVEKSRIAWGQTGLSTAIVRLHYSNEVVAKMALMSYGVFDRFEQEVGARPGFVKCGFAIGASERDLPAVRDNVAMQTRIGIKTRLISPQELREIEPHINVVGLAGAAYEPDSGFADPVLTSQAFAAAAKQTGATITEGVNVQAMDVEGGRITTVRTSKEPIEVDAVVNAAGVWANKVAAMVGEKLPIDVVKEEIAVFRRPREFSGTHIVYGDLPNDFYMRPAGIFETYVGALTPNMSRRDLDPDEVGIPMHIDFATTSRYSASLVDRFAVMGGAQSTGGWTGLYDLTPDWHPILDRSAKVVNLYHAVGLSGHGFKLCPAIGVIIAELITKGRCTAFDTNLFSLKRFKEGRLAPRKYEHGVLA